MGFAKWRAYIVQYFLLFDKYYYFPCFRRPIMILSFHIGENLSKGDTLDFHPRIATWYSRGTSKNEVIWCCRPHLPRLLLQVTTHLAQKYDVSKKDMNNGSSR
jgi:hypothetical protein